MIRIEKHAAPARYYTRVQRCGRSYLLRNPHPTSNEFKQHAYWREIHSNLYRLYHGICAYCALWSPRHSTESADQTSIDHFVPKSIAPNLAYEWDNFRLCRSRLNKNKSDHLVVIDPFYVVNGWFSMDFDTFLIVPLEDAPTIAKTRIEQTINCLGLNDNDYVNERVNIIRQYCLETVTIDDLKRFYPFIAFEIIRTNFDYSLKPQMQEYFRRNPYH